MPKRTYLDSNILLCAWQGKDDVGMRAIEVLDDPDREFILSDAVWLEIMPKPIFQQNKEEVDFYKEIFEGSIKIEWDKATLGKALSLAESYGIAAMDAIHVAIAIDANADELVTAEKSSKPMFRVHEISIESIRD